MAFFLYDLLYTLPFSMLAAAASAQWFRLFEPSVLLFVLTGVFCIAFCAFLRLGKWGRTVEVLVLFLTAFLIVLLVPKEGERAAFLAAHQWVFYCFLLTFGVFLLEQLLSRFLYAKCVLAGLLLCGLAAAVIWNYALSGTIVSAAGFFILCTAAEAVRQEAFRKGAEKAPERRAEKDEKTGTARYMAYLSPFLLAVFLYGAFYHAPEEPYRWEFVKRAYADAASFVDRIRIGIFQNGSESYEDGIVGFSDRSIFPGTVSGGGREVMELRSDSYARTQVYLIGKVFTDFEEQTWQSFDETDEDEVMMDETELMAAIRRFDPENRLNYATSAGLWFAYRYFSSSHVFHPLKTSLSANRAEGIDFTAHGANLIAQHRISYQDEYHLRYYRLNRTYEGFQNMLRVETPVEREVWEETSKDLSSMNRRELTYEAYLSYQTRMEQVYGKAPELTARTKAWLEEAIGEAETAYDKAVRIEKALRTFDYDSSPGKLPSRIRSAGDFLDWFIFEGKRGYCNHYGTALTLLCRAAGIPARYVQGFLADVSSTPMKLMSASAHSWCEIYVRGFGWLTMDATPGFGVDSSWTVRGEGSGHPDDWEGEDQEYHETDPEDEDAIRREEEARAEEEALQRRKTVRTVLILIGAVLLVILLIAVIRLSVLNKRYRDGTPDEKFRILMRRFLSLLESLGLPMAAGETLTEYQKRLDHFDPIGKGDREETTSLSAEQDDSLCKVRAGSAQFFTRYEQMLFRDEIPSDQSVLQGEALYESAKKLTKEARKWTSGLLIFQSFLKG